MGKPVGDNAEVFLVIKRPWPSIARMLWGDPTLSSSIGSASTEFR